MPEQRLLKLTSPMMRGDDVKDLQQRLKQLGYEITDVDGFFGSEADTADDRIAEFGNGDLRLCKYAEDDARYLNDCVVCMQEAASITIEAGTTPFYEGSSGVFNPTQYHRETRLEDVPVRAAVGCDWPYGARRYNGSGNSA